MNDAVLRNNSACLRITNETITNDPAKEWRGVVWLGFRHESPFAVVHAYGIPSQMFTFNARDQATGDTYDANRNLLASGSNTYVWDFANRLKSFNSGAVAMIYDGDGNRVSKTTAGATTSFLVDDLNPTGYAQVIDEISAGEVQHTYTYGLNRISESQPMSETFTPSLYGYDGEGHVRFLVNTSGAAAHAEGRARKHFQLRIRSVRQSNQLCRSAEPNHDERLRHAGQSEQPERSS